MKVVELPQPIYTEIEDRRKFIQQCFDTENAHIADAVELPTIVSWEPINGMHIASQKLLMLHLKDLGHPSPVGRQAFFVVPPSTSAPGPDGVMDAQPARYMALGPVFGTVADCLIIEGYRDADLKEFNAVGLSVILL